MNRQFFLFCYFYHAVANDAISHAVALLEYDDNIAAFLALNFFTHDSFVLVGVKFAIVLDLFQPELFE